MHINHARIIVFARAPVKGQVKSRLASSLGENAALDIYLQLLEATFSTVVMAGYQAVCYADQPEHEYFHRWKKHGVKISFQTGDDLGERMFNALAAEQSGTGSLILLGSDCPQLSMAILNEVESRLYSGNQVVIVPSEDGGYVLIAFKNRVYEALFRNIAWSTEMVLGQTVDKLQQLGLSYCLLEPLLDIDTRQDYRRWLSISQRV